MNPTQINQGGAQNQEKQPPEQTGSFKPPQQPVSPYGRDKESGENPEADTGRAAPDRAPEKKKTGEF